MMHWSISTSLLLAAGADLALGSHNHHVHHHQKIKPHVQVARRELDGLDINRTSPNTVVETRTLTTTIFEDCIPTNTRYVTTTIFEDYPEPTTSSEVESSQELPFSAFNPQSAPIENVLQPVTATIQTIASKPTPVEEQPQQDNSNTPESSSQFVPLHPQSTQIEPAAQQTTSQEQTTTIHMTKTVTDTTTETPTVFSTKTASSPDLTAPLPSDASIEERPAPDSAKKDPAPQNPHLLQSLPSILPGNPTDIIPHLPVPGLDNVLHPDNPPVPADIKWTSLPPNNKFSTHGFGGHSKPAGTRIQYHGNVGVPWGSNIIAVSPTEAHRYKYVAQFTGANSEPWTVIIWNKFGPDGKMDGWYSHSALTFVLAPGETRYVAFDEDSVGAWGAAPGTNGLPTDKFGGYTSTWGEFSFGDVENNGWSGWDVSAIQAQIAKQKVQGMKICLANGKACSTITPGAKKVIDAYTESKKHHDGIGGAAPPGPVRLAVDLDYNE